MKATWPSVKQYKWTGPLAHVATPFPLEDATGCVWASLVPGAEEERLVHTDALPVN